VDLYRPVVEMYVSANQAALRRYGRAVFSTMISHAVS
jgi:hypothetical protein